MKALINACIYDFQNFKENQYILFDSEIKEVGNMDEFPGAEEIYDCSKALVMPGLVNCHTHIYSTFSRGMNIHFNPVTFQDILDQLWWKLDSQLDKNDVYYSGVIYGVECVRNGVTSIIDHHASGLDIKGTLNELKKGICDKVGLRGIFCFETSDRFDIEECIEENLEFSKKGSERYAGLFGLHASMSLSDETLAKVSKNIGNTPIHIHVAESKEDETISKSKYSKNIVERLDSFGLLKDKSILAHCVHIDEEEVKLISKRGCYIAMNPTSNMNNAVGLANYTMIKSYQIPCLVGNDGLGVNITRDFLNLVFAMKNRLSGPAKFTLEDLVQCINNGYKYIGNILNIKIGRIEKGYKADMIAVPYTPPTPMNESNALGHIFFGVFDNFHPKDTWCSGKCLMRDYKVSIDDKDIYFEASKSAQGLWNRVNKS